MSDDLIRVGNAPVSWGSLELEGIGTPRIDYRTMLDELKETGYEGTELGDWGYLPTDPSTLRAELARRALTMVGAFVAVRLADESRHVEGERRGVRVARLLGACIGAAGDDHRPFVVLSDDNGSEPARAHHAGRVGPDLALDDEGWRTFARGAERIARAVRDAAGLPTVFHHHCGGYVETPEEIATFLDRTDPELIGLVLDTGHYAFGSGTTDRAAVPKGLERFGDRVRYVQLKDCDPAVAERARGEGWDYLTAVRRGVFCELGKGCVDFPVVVAWLRRRDYRGWVLIEQDVLPGMGAPKASAARSRAYLRSLGL